MFDVNDNGAKGVINNGNIIEMLSHAKHIIERALWQGPVVMTIERESKTRSMEQKYHAMMGEIRQALNPNYSLDIWKAKLIVDFEAEYEQAMGEKLKHGGEWTMSLKKQFPIYVRPSSAKFKKLEGCLFIEYLYRFGAENKVAFSDDSMKYYEEAAQYVKEKQIGK